MRKSLNTLRTSLLPLALITSMLLFLSGCIQEKEKLVDTLDTTDETILKPFGVHLGVDNYLDGGKSKSDWLAIENDGEINDSSNFYYSVNASTPVPNTDFTTTTYYIDKLTNTIVGLEFSTKCWDLKKLSSNNEFKDCCYQMLVLAKALSKSLDEKYQDFFTFKGHHEFGVYEISASKIKNGEKVRHRKRFRDSDDADKYIDKQILTGKPFAGYRWKINTINPRTTYRYYSKFMNELNRVDDIKIILRSQSVYTTFKDLPNTETTYLTYSLSKKYLWENYESKWKRAVKTALFNYNKDINSAKVESKHY